MFHVHIDNRVIAFHRWVPSAGRDVVVVASLNQQTFYDHGHQLGFPLGGKWLEVFNSDVYENYQPFPARQLRGRGRVGSPMHGLPTSARITLPANAMLVFARDAGDF